MCLFMFKIVRKISQIQYFTNLYFIICYHDVYNLCILEVVGSPTGNGGHVVAASDVTHS